MNKLLLVIESDREVPEKLAMQAALRCQERANAFLAGTAQESFVILLGGGMRLARAFQIGDGPPIYEIEVRIEPAADHDQGES